MRNDTGVVGIWFTSPSNICWRLYPLYCWVMWNIGTFTNPCDTEVVMDDESSLLVFVAAVRRRCRSFVRLFNKKKNGMLMHAQHLARLVQYLDLPKPSCVRTVFYFCRSVRRLGMRIWRSCGKSWKRPDPLVGCWWPRWRRLKMEPSWPSTAIRGWNIWWISSSWTRRPKPASPTSSHDVRRKSRKSNLDNLERPGWRWLKCQRWRVVS